ncbi:hypothetical protein [Aquimarina sp. 2201CG5-10]|uniref:hypothetical protein n=1 Tax=Aquimarina callyspongiae TaxID=3098150 RepID=UPI002AB3B4ED|nr:hypothetical protein [Aquimarina sp. 2201CG5-10]MDY8138100.1 hypothetical protein [Aquimarina sp. 2201CG5-10]
MAFRTLYKTLFQVMVHHSYFLDDGESSFISMNEDEKKEQLKKYDFSQYLTIVPSYSTFSEMENHKLILRKNNDGFRILNSVTEEDEKFRSKIFLSDNLTLTFLLYSNDYLFDNYTALPQEANRLYYFSNIKPDTEADPYTYISLNSSNDLVTEDLLLTEESTQQLWYEIEQDNIRAEIKARLNLIAEIEPEDIDSDEGKQIINQSIQKEQGKGLIGIIRLQMIGDNNRDVIEIDNTDPEDIKNFLLDPIPVYKLHFDNRKTIWKYIKKSDDNELETSSVKPLTRNGFIEIEPEDDLVAPLPDDIEKYVFPNPTANIIKQVTDENTNTITTYSEIYI